MSSHLLCILCISGYIWNIVYYLFELQMAPGSSGCLVPISEVYTSVVFITE